MLPPPLKSPPVGALSWPSSLDLCDQFLDHSLKTCTLLLPNYQIIQVAIHIDSSSVRFLGFVKMEYLVGFIEIFP